VIIKGNQRGGGQALAAHLMNARDNDHVELHEVRGFLSNDLAGAFREVEAAAAGSKCRQPFFSVSLNPPKGYNPTIEEFELAADLIEDKIPALKGQPRTMQFHEKDGRRHCHVVWSRINERGRAVQLSHSREKLKDVSRAMYAAMGIEAPAGIRDRTKANPLNYDIGVWQQAKRMGEDPRDLKQIVQDAWAASDDRASFERALEFSALYLARGDKRGFVIVDPSGEALSLTRYSGVKSPALKARLGEPEKLPTVDQVRSMVRDKMLKIVPPEPGNRMRARHREERRPLADEHRRMKAAHR
jgi:relaxase-like protein